jgi:hypothetical protein
MQFILHVPMFSKDHNTSPCLTLASTAHSLSGVFQPQEHGFMAAAPTMTMNGTGQQQLISILLLVSHQLILGINNMEYHCPQEFPSTSANNALNENAQ